MNVISRIQFPRTPETSNLYINCNEFASLDFHTKHTDIVLIKNGFLSLNTYFNSFYEKFYAKYTELSELYYLLMLEGDFQVYLYREQHSRENRELVHTESFKNCQPSEPVKISLPSSWRSDDAGRLYLEIICLSERGSFIKGFLATNQPKIREVSLGIITCTFRKEDFVKKTVSVILEDDVLSEKNFKVFVVDNGKTLKEDEFEHQNVQLFYNKNVGGAGGFTRGLIQALQENIYTHFLFMDDDIELESESIHRLFTLYEYANQDFAISGSMLDLYKKYELYEAGALFGKWSDSDGRIQDNPFSLLALKSNINLKKNFNSILVEDRPDYGGFWFLSFSLKTLNETGLPMPFFIRADDVEFGLRITRYISKTIVAFPGIAVWHEPFYAKSLSWINYYDCRNYLITHSIYDSVKYLDVVKFLTKSILHKIFLFDYNSAGMILKGFEDYMKGPVLINNSDAETLHTDVLAQAKNYKNQNLQTSLSKDEQNSTFSYKNNVEPTFKTIMSILTLNGHLIPNFLLSGDDVLYYVTSDYSDRWTKVFGKKRVVILMEGNNNVYQYEMSHPSGIGILIRWLKLITNSYIRWSSVSSEWKRSFKHFTSNEFWSDYLQINEKK